MDTDSDKKTRKSRLEYKSLTTWILLLSCAVSFSALVIYIAEADFKDTTLYILLIVLRYSSFMVCLCSLHKIAMHIYGVFRGYKFHVKKFIIFICFFLYGVFIIFFETFILAISRGNE